MPVSIEVTDATYRVLRELAGEASIQDTVAAAVEELRMKRFWDESDAAWAEELAERALWDCTLLDGLEDEPPYPFPSSS